MLPTVRISAQSNYHHRQQQQQKRRQYVRGASLQDIDDESTTSTGEDSTSPQSVTVVDDLGTTVAVGGGSTTMCSTDLAALELSPPLTDCSSVGSDDRGIWMTSTLSPPAQQQQRSRMSNGGGPPLTHHHVGGGGYRPLTARHHSSGSSSSNNSFQHQQRHHPNQKFGGSPEPDDGEVIQRICLVCGDAASGHHYGIASCEACKAFFKRTVQGRIQYSCSADGLCEMTKKRRKSCPACRYEKCLNMGMNPEGIRLDRRKGGRHKHFRSSMDFDDGSCSEMQDGGGGGIESLHSLIASQTANHGGENHMLERLMKIEPPKVLAMPDPMVPDSEQKFMMNLSNLADRELVATISWAKLIPGFSSLPLADEMNMIQNAWNHVLCFNLGYRSATPTYNGYLVFAEDLRVAESESQGVGIWGELDNVSRSIAKKMSELRVTKEEHVLIKAILLLNADVEVENPTAIVTLRDQLFDSLLEYESVHCGTEVFHRVGRLMLLLPLITHQVVLSRQYWLGVKLSGAVSSNRLLSEMVENTLREAFMDEMREASEN